MTSGYAVTISAVDRASGQIEAINRRLAAIRAPIDRAERAMERFGKLTGLTAVKERLQQVASNAVRVASEIARIAPALGAVSGAASVAGMARLVTEWAAFGQRLGLAAQRAGVSADKLAALEGAAQLAGASAGSLTAGFTTLRDTLRSAVIGQAPEAVAMLTTLGISFRDASGHARSAAQILPEIANRIAALKDPSKQAQVATTLLGGAGEELLPLLRRGAQGLLEYTAAAREYGVMTDESTRHAIEFRTAMARVRLAAEGLANAIGDQLGPVFAPMLTGFAAWIAKNRDFAASWIGDKVQRFVGFLQGLDWNTMAAKAEGVANRFLAVAQAIERVTLAAGRLFGSNMDDVPPDNPLFGMLPPEQQQRILEGGHAPGSLRDREERAPDFPWAPVVGPRVPRGLRNNNPLNLSYAAGQPGVLGADGRYGVFPSLPVGVAAAERQLLRYSDRDHIDTVRGLVSRWAPPGENDTGAYIAAVADRLRVSPDAHLNLRDAATAEALILAMGRHETGTEIDPAGVHRGVAIALGAPVDVGAGAAAAAPERGRLDVHIHTANAAPGTKVNAVSRGNVVNGPPRIEHSMPWMGGP